MKRILILLTLVFAMSYAEEETIYRLPPIRHSTREERYQQFLNDGRWLMELKGIPAGDETLVCTNWACPTSIVVDAKQYSVATNMGRRVMHFSVMTTNVPPLKVANGYIDMATNGTMARLVAFANWAQTSIYLPDYARGVAVQDIGPSTNMLFVTDAFPISNEIQMGYLTYKNIMLEVHAPTNALDFAVAIINAGLPEGERIAVPTVGQ